MNVFKTCKQFSRLGKKTVSSFVLLSFVIVVRYCQGLLVKDACFILSVLVPCRQGTLICLI